MFDSLTNNIHKREPHSLKAANNRWILRPGGKADRERATVVQWLRQRVASDRCALSNSSACIPNFSQPFKYITWKLLIFWSKRETDYHGPYDIIIYFHNFGIVARMHSKIPELMDGAACIPWNPWTVQNHQTNHRKRSNIEYFRDCCDGEGRSDKKPRGIKSYKGNSIFYDGADWGVGRVDMVILRPKVF